MKRHMLVALAIGCSGAPSVSPKSEASEAPLPGLRDYVLAGPTCQRSKKLYAKVTGRAVVFGKTAECELLIHDCSVEPWTRRSGPRPSRQGVCGDYYAAAAELTGPVVCCDQVAIGDDPGVNGTGSPRGSSGSGDRGQTTGDDGA